MRQKQNTDADRILTIAEQGFEGHFYDAMEKEKVVITFSGSEGGSSASDTMAYYYRQSGISALGVTLFAGIDTGKFLDQVPLEYVENAIRWLKDQGYKKIAVDGISKGSEYALLAASMFEEISCVIARVPSYFISEGMIGKKGPSGDSCWSYQRNSLNYVPYKIRRFNVKKQFITHREFNILEYNTNKDIGSEAIIPMERIRGPILLISTEADTVWPSVQQADYIEEYLLDRNFSYEVMNLKYQYISHFAIPMRRNEGLLKLLFKTERKHPNECAVDREDITSKVIDFIRNHWQS
ncbi:acyl-CoA thioester hydrolase/BAAT C-terminal domain-containing protein [Lachnoclostridium sp. Marseille-P6806]|uniref:acyl-CoA thioester hydrolase/BAAT C-terminal domain-containing protein n=1 Tax=Lachnoclostridium sp. Marseille-P6806 TaxID=2364793 RepID=UPI001031BA59|nr:acyl-CoA thioester hydrolase/BAAT C-terminal domain-containing protein [Lachnoclostridium sp. Marseille-P6806]